MTERPRAPSPKTATVVPGSTLVLLKTAPQPVATPQPSRHILSRSAPGLILAALISAITAYSAKVLQPMKWKIGWPSLESREVPSGITPCPWVDLMVGHRLVFWEAQKMQDCFLHSGV